MANIEEVMGLQLLERMEEMEEREGYQRHGRKQPEDPFLLSNNSFIKKFRLSKNLTRDLILELSPFLTEGQRINSITVETKVLVALRFFAQGSYQLSVGESKFLNMSQPSVSNCVSEVVDGLNQPVVFNKFVKFPNMEELNRIRTRFYTKFNMPGIIGCIDGTHVAIVPPKKEEENVYINRKGYHSLNVQLIVDDNLKILNVNARFPGGTHDSYIWDSSRVKHACETMFRNGQQGYYLLGDSGYAQRPWMMTPINPEPEPNSPEFRYNERHRAARNTVERCNGVLKMRFRCLLKHRVLHYTPNKATKIVNACAILHNICIENNVPEPDIEDEALDLGMYNAPINLVVDAERRLNPDLAEGRRIRAEIIRNYFQ